MTLHYRFRQITSQVLLVLLVGSVLMFGSADVFAAALIQTALAVLAFVWAIRKVRNPYSFVASSLYVPFGVIIAAAAVQLFLETSALPGATAMGLVAWLAYAAFFVIAVNVQADPTIRMKWPPVLCWLAVAVSVLAIVQMPFERGFVLWRPIPGLNPFGLFADREYFAVFAELLFPLALVTALATRRKSFLSLAAATTLAAAVAASGSKTGFLLVTAEFLIIFVVEVGLIALQRGREAKRIVSSAGALALVASVLIVSAIIGQLDPSQRDALGPADIELLRETAWALFLQAGALGHGLGSFFSVYDAGYSTTPLSGMPGAEPVRFAAELGIAGIVAQALVIGLIPILARTRKAWLGAVLPLAAAWVHSWDYGWLNSPALVLIAAGLLAFVASDGARRPMKGVLRRKLSSPPATQIHQNHSPQREYQVSLSE